MTEKRRPKPSTGAWRVKLARPPIGDPGEDLLRELDLRLAKTVGIISRVDARSQVLTRLARDESSVSPEKRAARMALEVSLALQQIAADLIDASAPPTEDDAKKRRADIERSRKVVTAVWRLVHLEPLSTESRHIEVLLFGFLGRLSVDWDISKKVQFIKRSVSRVEPGVGAKLNVELLERLIRVWPPRGPGRPPKGADAPFPLAARLLNEATKPRKRSVANLKQMWKRAHTELEDF